jgi:rod shape-determining protein MreC
LKNRYFALLIIVIVVSVCVILNATSFYSSLRNTSVNLLSPLFEKTYFVFYNFTDAIGRLSSYPLLTQQNQKLLNENAQLRRELIDKQEIEAENVRLKNLLDLTESHESVSLSAKVIGRDMSLWSNWIMIDRGSDHSIIKDTPLIAQEGLVGKVSFIGKNTARCILIIDRRSKVSGLVQRSRDIGIVEGTDEGMLKMRYLSIKADIVIGDIILTSGLGGIYPKALPIGTVITLGKDPNGLHLFATIRPFVDFNTLEEVACLRK